MEKIYKIYKHTFPNKKVYIGLTCKSINDRWSNGEGYKTQFVYKAIKKYGWENIKHEVIDYANTLDEANQKEMFYIKKYNSNNCKFGYNLTLGGDGVKGRKVTKKQLKYMSLIGKNCWKNKSKEQKLEQIRRIKIASKNGKINLGRKHTKEEIDKMSGKNNGMYGKKPINAIEATRKEIKQYSMSGNFIKLWSSTMEIERELGIYHSHITRCCKHKQKFAKGFMWEYA